MTPPPNEQAERGVD